MSATERAQRTRRKVAGVRLRALRERYGLGLEAAAEILGLTEHDLRDRELGLQAVTADELWRLSLSLGISPAAILEVPVSSGELSDRGMALRRKGLGAALALARESCGLSVDTAEASVGLPEGWLSAAERGEVPVTLADLEALAALYESSVGEWLTGDEGDTFQSGREFAHRPGKNRYMLAAMTLSRLDAEALSALEDVVKLLQSDE